LSIDFSNKLNGLAGCPFDLQVRREIWNIVFFLSTTSATSLAGSEHIHTCASEQFHNGARKAISVSLICLKRQWDWQAMDAIYKLWSRKARI